MSNNQWIPVSVRLPNEDEIRYDSIFKSDSERERSDRVLAVDKNQFIRTGYFIKSGSKHDATVGKRWDFGEHFKNNPEEWVVTGRFEPIAWMPLPEPPEV